VNTDEKQADFKRLAKERGVTWKQSWQGSRQGPWPESWGIFSYPTVIVLDEDGVIRAVEGKSWQQAAEALTGTVEKLVADLETKRRGETPPK
jgi:hypothetical protein